jgi:tetratricopeptide (TPR) repeat protein
MATPDEYPSFEKLLEAIRDAQGNTEQQLLLVVDATVSEDQAEAWVQQLTELTFVEPFDEREGWNVHDATRTAFRRRLAQDQFGRFSELSRRLAECFMAIRIEEQVERLFHRLAAGIAEAPDELNAQWKSWHRGGRTAPLQMLGLALEELSGQPTLPAACRGRVLYCLASIRRTRWTLDRSLKLIEESRVAFDAQVDLAGRMDAFDLQGILESTAGRNDAALRSYRAAFDLATQLIQQEPMRWEWQRELAVGHNKVGSILQAQGKLSEALREYEQSCDIRLRLTAHDPANTDWQRDLSVSHNNVGSILQAQGKLSEALREYEQSRDILLRLTAHDPANTDWQRDLSVSHTNVGGVLFRLQRLDDALQSCQAARDLRQKCLIADSLRVDNYRELAVIDFWIASIHQEKRQWQAAHEAIVLAVTSIQEARRRSPETVEFREVEQVIMARMQQIEKQMRKS